MEAPKARPSVGPTPPTHIFLPRYDQHNKPSKIVTLGHYYPKAQVNQAKTFVEEAMNRGSSASGDFDANAIRDHLFWTRFINALNAERQWPLKRLFDMLDPMLGPDIAIATVPPHKAYQAFWPVRTL